MKLICCDVCINLGGFCGQRNKKEKGLLLLPRFSEEVRQEICWRGGRSLSLVYLLTRLWQQLVMLIWHLLTILSASFATF
jgi:hypothetical protein